MNDKEFAKAIVRAVAGEHDAIEKILVQYNPLFENISRVNGIIDEDLKQYIMMRLIIQLPKFNI